jgi:UDP-2,4-diacetamido-2,4,6-trideoxy-beta-L-altropyranose hydrolase
VGELEDAHAVALRDVTDDDCKLVWEWANEPEVRAASFNSKPIAWEEHVEWFRRMRADRRSRAYVVLEEDRREVGIVRFDLDDESVGVVGINLVPTARGRGIGTRALRLACARVRHDAQAVAVLAYVKPENVASLRSFARAGFTAAGETRVNGVPAAILRWEPDRSDTA